MANYEDWNFSSAELSIPPPEDLLSDPHSYQLNVPSTPTPNFARYGQPYTPSPYVYDPGNSTSSPSNRYVPAQHPSPFMSFGSPADIRAQQDRVVPSMTPARALRDIPVPNVRTTYGNSDVEQPGAAEETLAQKRPTKPAKEKTSKKGGKVAKGMGSKTGAANRRDAGRSDDEIEKLTATEQITAGLKQVERKVKDVSTKKAKRKGNEKDSEVDSKDGKEKSENDEEKGLTEEDKLKIIAYITQPERWDVFRLQQASIWSNVSNQPFHQVES